MDKRVLKVLEFDKIIVFLTELTASPMGKEYSSKLTPSVDFFQVLEWQEETTEAEALLYSIGRSPVDEFQDLRSSLKKAQIGSVLSLKEILELGHLLKVSRVVKDQIPKDDSKYIRIYSLSSGLYTHPDLEEEIRRCILSEDEISDYATPELANIRRKIRSANEKIREKLNNIIRSPQYQKYLQEPIITVRNGRYVVPVKQEYRSSVQGLIHDQSSSGATLFIEPMSVVEANNDLRQWESKEKAEIERILMLFTAKVEGIASSLESNLHLLARLDFIFAKGQLSRQMRAVAPKLNQSKYIRVLQARHPLIAADQVVPLNLSLGMDFTTLVITGPNTGGKTVTLKTIGLFCLMAQAGLHVPGDIGTELCIFKEIFADIGDEQSIEQSLSTFSSHMTQIVSILNAVTPDSLVLFDELGAGTDPTEGAALAMAILDRLHASKVRTMATTHYSELKAFAMTRDGIENASMEFDVETLRPTYRLLIGIPGKSNAFEISKRLGLDDGIIGKAREYISQENINFEDIISNAETHRKLAEKDRLLAEEARKEMMMLRENAAKQKNELDTQKDKILRAAREEAKRILTQAKDESETIIRELKKMAEEQDFKEREAEEHRLRLKTGVDVMDQSLNKIRQPVHRLSKPPKDIKPGDPVYVINLDQKGIALNKPDGKGELLVQVGILKINVHISNLREVDEPVSDSPVYSKKQINIRDRQIGLDLDLRGQTLGEAVINLDKYLDDAFLTGLSEVNIIHGKGTGALRSGIQQHLRRHPHVKTFRLGKFGEGESGVTVIELK